MELNYKGWVNLVVSAVAAGVVSGVTAWSQGLPVKAAVAVGVSGGTAALINHLRGAPDLKKPI